MSSEELKLFNNKPKYKIKETGEIVDFHWLEKIIACHQERLKILSEIGELSDFFFKEKIEYEKDLLKWKEMTDEEIINSLDKSEKILSQIDEKDWQKETIEQALMEGAGADRGSLLWPLRVVLSGKKASASPFDIVNILGKEKTLKRISGARQKLEAL